jgi:phage-related protein
VRKIIVYKRYFLDFYEKQSKEVQKKIEWILGLLRDLEFIPTKYFKKVESKIYEVRIQAGTNIFRVFAFFDKENIIVLGNAFHKKTQKLPRKEIDLAKRIMEEYFSEKK